MRRRPIERAISTGFRVYALACIQVVQSPASHRQVRFDVDDEQRGNASKVGKFPASGTSDDAQLPDSLSNVRKLPNKSSTDFNVAAHLQVLFVGIMLSHISTI